MIGKLRKSIKRIISRRFRMKQIEKLIDSGLPGEMRSALEYLVTGKSDSKTDVVVKHAENRRAAIASYGEMEVPIWYSPKPGSSRRNSSSIACPEPGKVIDFTMEKVAKTGKGPKWGTVLYLIARAFQSTTVFELGTCAGISTMYLSSPQSIKKLIKIEGSKALAEIAEESLKAYGHVKVVNSLFDEAMDTELPSLSQNINLAYIDGHHEKVATIHYLNRLLPSLENGAVVIFDDISWSYDMREAWDIICKRQEFSHTIDLGAIGVCILKTKSDDIKSEPQVWDLQPILGKFHIRDPKGWRE